MTGSSQATILIPTSGGTTLGFTGTDDGYSNDRAIGFTGSFFGTSFTTVDVATNGNLNFTNDTTYTNTAFTGTGTARIAPLWDDMILTSGAVIENVSAGNYYSVTWNGVALYNIGSSSVTTQATLFGASQTVGGFNFQANDIVFSYGSVSGFVGSNASIGLNSGTGKFAVFPGTAGGVVTSAPALPTAAGQFILYRPDGAGAYVASSMWDGGGNDSNSNNATNWVGDATPSSAATQVIFNGSTRLTPNLNANLTAGGITFVNTAGAFVIGGSSSITVPSILNNSSNLQTINTAISAPSGLSVGGSANTTLGGVISGTTLTKTGSGTLTFSGSAANTYTGVTTVNSGTLVLNKTAAVAIGGNVTIGDASGVDILQLSGTGGNQIADTSILTFKGSGSNAGTLRMNGLSETIGGLVSTGGEGIVQNNTSGTSTLTLDVSGTNRDFSGVLQNGAAGTLAVSKSGNAVQTLSGTNTYSGLTTVSGGKLTVAPTGTINGTSSVLIAGGELNYNSSTALSKNVTFSGSSGTLSGSGTITNAVTLSSGNRYTPGELNAVGTQTLSGGITFESGSIFQWDLDTGTGNYDKVTAALTANPGAKFQVASSTAFSNSFWDVSRTWSNIFGANPISGFNVSNFLFSEGGTSVSAPLSQGYFTITGGTSLNWNAVPEPSSALAGILLGAGLLRRRRHAA